MTASMIVRVMRIAWPVPVILAAVLYMTGPALDARLSILDDHEVPLYLGPDRTMTWGEAWDAIRDNALTWNHRFLAVHYVVRVLELKLRGFDAGGWHLDRTVMGCACALAVYAAAACFVHPLGALAAALAYLAGAQSQAFISLGFTETTGSVFALTGAALLAWHVRAGRDRPARLWPGLVLVLLAGACKESFVPLLPAAVAVLYGPRVVRGSPLRRPLGWSRADWAVLALFAATSLAIVVTNVAYLKLHGHQYRGSLRAEYVFAFARRLTTDVWAETNWPAALLGAAAALALVPPIDPAAIRRRLAWFAAAVAGLFVVLVLPQCIIYGTTYVFSPRYLIPGHYFAVFAIALGLGVIQRAPATRMRWVTPALFATVAVSVVIASAIALRSTRAAAVAFAESSRLFAGQMEEIERIVAANPGSPVVFQTGEPTELEAVVSVRRFLSAGPAAGAKYFLRFTPPNRKRSDPFVALLNDQMMRLVEGRAEGFSPIAEYPADGPARCIGVHFFGANDFSCPHVVILRGNRS